MLWPPPPPPPPPYTHTHPPTPPHTISCKTITSFLYTGLPMARQPIDAKSLHVFNWTPSNTLQRNLIRNTIFLPKTFVKYNLHNIGLFSDITVLSDPRISYIPLYIKISNFQMLSYNTGTHRISLGLPVWPTSVMIQLWPLLLTWFNFNPRMNR